MANAILEWIAKCQPGLSRPSEEPVEKALDSLMQLFDCPICCDFVTNPTQTPCGHVLCSRCLQELFKAQTEGAPVCPLCKTRVTSRGLTPRNDIGDMKNVVIRLSEVFVSEVREFLDKKGNSPGQAPPSSKVLRRIGKESATKSVRAAKSQKNANKQTESKVAKSNVNPKAHVEVINQIVPSRTDETRRRSQTNSDYVIVSTSIVPQALPGPSLNQPDEVLDLSVAKKKPGEILYVCHSAFKFVKPLDLSMKKEKRKLDKVDKEPITASMTSGQICASDAEQNINKRSKFDGRVAPHTAVDEIILSDSSAPSSSSGSSIGVMSQLERKKDQADKTEKVTNSDEMLLSFLDDVLPEPSLGSGVKSQLNKTKAMYEKATADVFKPPVPKTMPSTKGTGKNSQELSQRSQSFGVKSREAAGKSRTQEDDFYKPHESDALFLELPDEHFRTSPANHRSSKSSEKENLGNTGLSSKSKKTDLSSSTNKSNEATTSSNNEVLVTSPQSSPATKSKDKPANNNDPNASIILFESESDSWMNRVSIPQDNGHSSQKSIPEETNHIFSDLASPQQVIFCPSRLNRYQRIKLHELSTLYGCKIAKDGVNEGFTHLIINLDNGRVPQTFKYLLAIAKRSWVVTFEWVEKCLENGKLIPEGPYETANFNNCDIGVRRSRLSKTCLFDGFRFYFASEEAYKNLGFTSDEVKNLINCLGAYIVTSVDEVEGSLIIIGSMNGNQIEYNHWLNTRKWMTLSFDWIIRCIVDYELKPFDPAYRCVKLSMEQKQTLNVPKALKRVLNS